MDSAGRTLQGGGGGNGISFMKTLGGNRRGIRLIRTGHLRKRQRGGGGICFIRSVGKIG